MRFLHTSIRISDVEESLDFYCNKLGMREIVRSDVPSGKFTLFFLAAPDSPKGVHGAPQLEMIYNWEPEEYEVGRAWAHLAFTVEDIYGTCRRLQRMSITLNRPPHDGRLAFIKSPDDLTIMLVQAGKALIPQEPWISMPNIGSW